MANAASTAETDDVDPHSANLVEPVANQFNVVNTLALTFTETIIITVDGLNGNDNECIIDPINAACRTLNGAQRAIGDQDDNVIILASWIDYISSRSN
jgi:hypothetical protein